MASTIKVDNVQNQPGTNIIDKCGTTITLGESGDTIALASGASQTGFGRTGTVDWITTPKVTGDSPVTGVTGKGYFLNTTAGTITFNLPAGTAGDIISVADYAGTWQTNNVTVTPNGSEKIGGVNASVVLITEGQSVTLIYVDSTQGWINTMDSTSNVRATAFVCATGGTPCTGAIVGDYKIHTFTGPGTLCVNAAGSPVGNDKIDYLVVAGGGSGGMTGPPSGPGRGGGGGGAGGYRESQNPAAAPAWAASPLASATSITASVTGYPIVVGGGGATATYPQPICTHGNPGTDSSGLGITSAGGGGGGVGINVSPLAPYKAPSGGSGGGAGASEQPAETLSGGDGDTPHVTPDQGFPGGSTSNPYGGWNSGGGGGATTVGESTGPGNCTEGGGDGGAGATTTISNTPTAYAGGGGGSGYGGPPSTGQGGTGGGGYGSRSSPAPGPTVASAGTCNTGGGGGAGVNSPVPLGTGAAGGSGIVIIRYKFQ